ncbi:MULTISPECIES: hypothetical protein [unclassified Caballeronia]|uniref:hypothetical protein n=1 Tax=unclassified Caballeronia TaxID=2646786 RepID=UPI001F27C9DB|nr:MULTISPECIES: hypothetical protein [unclassified Caballeronia]MCE4542122.1 hypothetical protein [Caballeronia sp. PC1]MCE4568832.1 hypothetical protein [Caballeronia sp. CLC5]
MSLPPGARRHRERGLWQIAPYAAKLTRQHRDAARADHAFERALREQTRYPERIDALIAGRTWFDGKLCERCDTTRRRVYDSACWTCQRKRTHFETDGRGRCVTRWTASQSRDGYLARQDERRRERAGDFIEYHSGGWRARSYPGGRLAVRCEHAHINNEDFRDVPGWRVFELCNQYPDLIALLRLAGWSI